MKRNKIIYLLIAFFVLIGVSIFFVQFFLSSLAAPKVSVTRDKISTNRDFVNGITIEKLLVDTIGNAGYPISYTTIYTTSCNINHPLNKPPSSIDLNKEGNYSWDEDTIQRKYRQVGPKRISLDTVRKAWWLDRFGKHRVCPTTFERQQWYFISVHDPRVTGIFFYIDSNGKEHQHFIASGVSPI